jgi:hypothetical protein
MIIPALSRTIMPGAASGGVPGDPQSGAYGNPGVMTNDIGTPQGWKYVETADHNVGPNMAANVRNPQEQGGYGIASGQTRKTNQPGDAYGGDPPNGHVTVVGVMQTPHNGWRGGFTPSTPNDRLLTSDRHIMHKVGNPSTLSPSTPGNPPNPDDPMQGPIAPVFATVNRSLNFQQGSDNTANEDDMSRPYSTTNNGAQFIGEQGSGWAPVYGGVPGLYQPYGSYSGYTARDTKGIQSPIGQGEPGDGPHKVFSGPPHGLHSVTSPDYSNTIGRYMSIPQMHSVRVDRPDNSKIAGQDYSQTVQPQGEVGTVTQPPTRFQSRSRFS